MTGWQFAGLSFCGGTHKLPGRKFHFQSLISDMFLFFRREAANSYVPLIDVPLLHMILLFHDV
jgi:hypothetical protein